jgi:hypothetical protein
LVAAWSRLPREVADSTVIVVVPTLAAAAPDCETRKGGVRVFLDPQRQSAQRYNAHWLPRAYALDEHGILTYVQTETTLDPQAPLQVEALWRGESSEEPGRGQ